MGNRVPELVADLLRLLLQFCQVPLLCFQLFAKGSVLGSIHLPGFFKLGHLPLQSPGLLLCLPYLLLDRGICRFPRIIIPRSLRCLFTCSFKCIQALFCLFDSFLQQFLLLTQEIGVARIQLQQPVYVLEGRICPIDLPIYTL